MAHLLARDRRRQILVSIGIWRGSGALSSGSVMCRVNRPLSYDAFILSALVPSGSRNRRWNLP